MWREQQSKKSCPENLCTLTAGGCKRLVYENPYASIEFALGFPRPYRRAPRIYMWHHPSCHEIMKSSYPRAKQHSDLDYLHDFSDAIKPLYKPSGKRERDKASVLEGLESPLVGRILKNTFRQELLRALPEEILDMVLGFIGPCRCLIVLGETRRLLKEIMGPCGTPDGPVQLSQKIYITRNKYQGVSYISRVRNTSFKELDEMDVKEEVLDPPHDIERLVVSTDHIGDGSSWYENIEISKSVLENGLQFRHGDPFLRKVQVASDSDSDDDSSTGSHHENVRHLTTPFIPDVKPWNTNSSGQNEISRLHYEPIGADTQVLIVCCSYAMNIGVHAFTGVSKEYKEFVRKMTAKRQYEVYWMYFPLNSGEHIRYFWIRQFAGCYGENSRPIIVLETTRDRTIRFGTYTNINLRNGLHFFSLVKDGDGFVSGIVHDGEDPDASYIGEMGVTTSKPPNSTATITSESSKLTEIPTKPSSNGNAGILKFVKRYRRGGPDLDSYMPPYAPKGSPTDACWHLTKAPLQNLSSVQTCQDTTQSHKPYIGMLLTYTDNTRECLGQFRWDFKISDNIDVPIRVQTGKVKFDMRDRYPLEEIEEEYFKNIWRRQEGEGSLEGCGDDEGREIPDKGTIIWWFGALGDKIVVGEGLDG